MNKILFLLCAIGFYAGCATSPETGSSGSLGLSGEQRVEGQLAREGGLSDRWVLKAGQPMTENEHGVPIVQAEEPRSAGTSGAVSTGGGRVETTEDQADIELRKEELVVEKRQVSNGSVLVRKVVQSETINKPIDLKREEYVIERIPSTDGQQNPGPGIATAFEPREIYLPLLREEPVSSKRTLLSETVKVSKRVETDRNTITRPVRHEELEVVKNPDLTEARFANVPRRAGATTIEEPAVASATPMAESTPDTVRLLKEELLVGKKTVDNGGVYLQKVVKTQDSSVPVELRREEFTIERNPAGDHPVAATDFGRGEYRINLNKEQAVVGTRNYVTELVRLRKQTQTDTQVVSGTIRKENVEIVKSGDVPVSATAPVGTVGTAVQTGSSSASELMPMSSGGDLATITGKAVCTKCQLKQTAVCENAIQVKVNGKTLTYHLADNAVTKNFHQEMNGKQVRAIGTVQESNGKFEFTATKISLVK